MKQKRPQMGITHQSESYFPHLQSRLILLSNDPLYSIFDSIISKIRTIVNPYSIFFCSFQTFFSLIFPTRIEQPFLDFL